MQLLWTALLPYLPLLVGSWVGCFALASTLAANRTRRWLLGLLELERQSYESRLTEQRASEMRRHNETLRILSEAYAQGERPSLESLLADERRDWSVTSRPESSELTPSNPPQPSDWSDDELQTTAPDLPRNRK
jgi:hypothetical protein